MDALGSRGNREQIRLELNSYEVACRFFTWNDRWRSWNVVPSGVDSTPGTIECRAKEANRRSRNAGS
jgi:hypothetical protein